MKNMISYLVFVISLLISYNSFGYTLSTINQEIDFDIHYGANVDTTTADSVIDLAGITITDEATDYIIYYVDYEITEETNVELQIKFKENITASMVSVFRSSRDQVAIKITNQTNPIKTLEGVIQFTIRDMIIKPTDNNYYNTNNQNDWSRTVDNKTNGLAQEAINLYPNPANQVLNLPQSHQIKTIHFISLLSNQTTIKRTHQNKHINIQDLTEGIYLVRMEKEGGQWNEQKLVIKH